MVDRLTEGNLQQSTARILNVLINYIDKQYRYESFLPYPHSRLLRVQMLIESIRIPSFGGGLQLYCLQLVAIV